MVTETLVAVLGVEDVCRNSDNPDVAVLGVEDVCRNSDNPDKFKLELLVCVCCWGSW